ncbi:hypothetical protein Tco_0243366 [Tanacetum coccineum]
MWLKLTLLGLVKRRSMLELFHCAASASFTIMARALQSALTAGKSAIFDKGLLESYWSDCPKLRIETMETKMSNEARGRCIETTESHRQKSYADLKRKSMEFQVGDRVMLKVSPWKGVVRFGKRGKLNPRYVGPFKVLAKVGAVAYKLELPQELSRVHNTFHVSNLKKCYADEPLAVPLDGLHIDDKLHFVEEPVEIMDHEVKRFKQSRVLIIKV